jgi:hypothetical protein
MSAGIMLSRVAGPDESSSNFNNLETSPLGQRDDNSVVDGCDHENGLGKGNSSRPREVFSHPIWQLDGNFVNKRLYVDFA